MTVAPHQEVSYTAETKSRALAMLQAGEQVPHVAVQCGVNERTLYTWAKRWRQSTDEQGIPILREQAITLSQRCGELLHDALDVIEESGQALKYMGPLNFIRGTNMDKIQKDQGPTVNVAVQIVNQAAQQRDDIRTIDA